MEPYVMTLREWQKVVKPLDDIIINASIENGSDNSHYFNYSIGLACHFVNLSPREQEECQIGTHNNTVLAAFANTTDTRRRRHSIVNRKIIENTLRQNGIHNMLIPRETYFNSIGRYKFIISPEGNGIDCHRHYEAIYVGSIPIIEDNIHMKRKYSGLPVLYTNDYSEITQEYLEQKYNEMIDVKYDFSKFFVSSFSENDQNNIRRMGEYWVRKAFNKNWNYPKHSKGV